jgi:hypothetical protein
MSHDTPLPAIQPELERKIREALASIRYGTITLVIQDSRVIQLDKSEKIRLTGQNYNDGGGI